MPQNTQLVRKIGADFLLSCKKTAFYLTVLCKIRTENTGLDCLFLLLPCGLNTGSVQIKIERGYIFWTIRGFATAFTGDNFNRFHETYSIHASLVQFFEFSLSRVSVWPSSSTAFQCYDRLTLCGQLKITLFILYSVYPIIQYVGVHCYSMHHIICSVWPLPTGPRK